MLRPRVIAGAQKAAVLAFHLESQVPKVLLWVHAEHLELFGPS